MESISKLIKNFITFLRKHLWQVVIFLFIICFLLGVIGFNKYLRTSGTYYRIADLVYLTIQLATLESGNTLGPISWELEVARFLMPLLAAYTAVLAAATVFRKQLDIMKLRLFRQHIIICGLGQKGWHLASQLRQNGRNVVVIEINPANPRIGLCREMGVIVLERDAREQKNLELAGINKADHLVALCGDSSINAEIAVLAKGLTEKRKFGILNCTIHVINPHLCNVMQDLEFGYGLFPSFRLEVINIFERGARLLVSNYFMFNPKIIQKNNTPSLLIFGRSRLTENVILQITRAWSEIADKENIRLDITVVAEKAQTWINEIRLRYPKLTELCHFTLHDLSSEVPLIQQTDNMDIDPSKCEYDFIFVGLENTTSGLQTALSIRHWLESNQPPIILYLPDDSGLARLLSDAQNNQQLIKNIISFRLVEETISPRLVLDGTHEVLAKAIHEDYLRHRLADGLQMGEKRAMVNWEDLPNDLKESNRRQVDHIRMKLNKIDYGIKPIQDWESVNFQFSADEIEELARMEHEHWMEERLKNGWVYKSGPKNPEQKTHPDLLPWEKLSGTAKEKDRQPSILLPKLLARAGFQIYKLRSRTTLFQKRK